MVKRNIIFISSLLLILNSCDNDDIPMYFRSMQPVGGKLFKGSVKDHFINSLPKIMYIGSKDLNFDSTYSEKQIDAQMEKFFFDLGLAVDGIHSISLGMLMLPIMQGADIGVQIIRSNRYIDLNIHFDDNKIIKEKFEVNSIFPDSIFNEKGTAIKKENIICFNKKNDNGYYYIEEIWEINRSDGQFYIYEKPFYVGMPGKRTNIFDDTRISNTPLESFDKQLGNMKKSFDLEIINFNDSLKTYSANPNYMSFRYALNKKSYDFNSNSSFLISVFESFFEIMESDSVKYGTLLDYLSTYFELP